MPPQALMDLIPESLSARDKYVAILSPFTLICRFRTSTEAHLIENAEGETVMVADNTHYIGES
jgi:hypothetical protein